MQLIVGMIEPKLTGEIIEYLIEQDSEQNKFINLFLAVKCLLDVRNRFLLQETASKLLNRLKELAKEQLDLRLLSK